MVIRMCYEQHVTIYAFTFHDCCTMSSLMGQPAPSPFFLLQIVAANSALSIHHQILDQQQQSDSSKVRARLASIHAMQCWAKYETLLPSKSTGCNLSNIRKSWVLAAVGSCYIWQKSKQSGCLLSNDAMHSARVEPPWRGRQVPALTVAPPCIGMPRKLLLVRSLLLCPPPWPLQCPISRSLD